MWAASALFVFACNSDGSIGGSTDGDGNMCVGCEPDELCRFNTCVPNLGTCATSNDCTDDSRCVEGECLPWGVPSSEVFDPTCTQSISIDAIQPAIQCRWTGSTAGIDSARHHVMATPVVVDFNLDNNPGTLAPSIVFASFPTANSYHGPAVLRVIDGASCTDQFSLTGTANHVMSPAPVATGDIDGDGRADIVAAAHGGGLLAFSFDAAGTTLSRAWRSGTCTPGMRVPDFTGGDNRWSGPSIHDLNNDGAPEILYGGVVYDRSGCLVSDTLGFLLYNNGLIPVAADIDEDGRVELVTGDAIYEWNTASSDWTAEAYFSGQGLSRGQVAVADMGNYPLAAFGGADRAEIVVVSDGSARVQTLEGTTVFGPFSIPGGGKGGAPTIADFDGDGDREFATAGGDRYAVFDLDCVTGGSAAKCGGQSRTDGVLWSQPSKDHSSNVTGSSVFDFNADGAAEAVYADECFLRIYEGSTGNVIYSVARSSGTTYENPVIVDVDGDFRTEIVSSVNDYINVNCPSTDPLSPSTSSANSHGIVVFRDHLDRWAASRPVWNQHAYYVTNVDDSGGIPSTSTAQVNWRTSDLNNFRQNVQGSLEALGVPDMTVAGNQVDCIGDDIHFQIRVCNRGALPMVRGSAVSFRDPTDAELCATATEVDLAPGECTEVGCVAVGGAQVLPGDIRVVGDPNEAFPECNEGNNGALLTGVECAPPVD